MDIENTLRDPRLDQRTCFLVSADDRAPQRPAQPRRNAPQRAVQIRPVVERHARPRRRAVSPRAPTEIHTPRPPARRARSAVGLLVFFWVAALSGSVAAIGTAMLSSWPS